MRLKRLAIALLASVISTVGITAVENASSSVVYAAESDFVIENGVLREYKGKGGDVVIPDGVTKIELDVFWNNTDIKSVYIPGSVSFIPSSAFSGCKNLKKVTLNEGLQTICDCAFAGTAISELKIPDSVLKISVSFIDECENITEFNLPKNVNEFWGFDAVTIFSEIPFRGCTNLKKITVDKDNSVYYSTDEKNAIISKEDKTLVSYISEAEEVHIPKEVKNVGIGAFANCKNMKKSVLHNGVSRIEGAAFYLCKSLKEVVIPNGVTDIGMIAFYCCKNLKSICIPSSATYVDAYAFESCIGLTDICFLGKKNEWENLGVGSEFSGLPKTVKIHFGHVAVKDKAVAATYAKTGLTEGSHCKACGTVIKKQKVVNKKTLSVPKMTSVKNSAKGKVTVKWNSVKDATGYQIYYTVGKTTKKITVKASSKASLSQVISKLTKGKSYSVKIRAYKTVGSKTYYSAWSSAKNIKITK